MGCGCTSSLTAVTFRHVSVITFIVELVKVFEKKHATNRVSHVLVVFSKVRLRVSSSS